MTEFHLNRDNNNMMHLRDAVYAALIHSLRFNEKLYNTFSEAYSAYIKTILEGNNIAKDLPELEKVVRSRISKSFDSGFREEDFVSTLSDTVASYSGLAKSIGFSQAYQNFSFLATYQRNVCSSPE